MLARPHHLAGCPCQHSGKHLVSPGSYGCISLYNLCTYAAAWLRKALYVCAKGPPRLQLLTPEAGLAPHIFHSLSPSKSPSIWGLSTWQVCLPPAVGPLGYNLPRSLSSHITTVPFYRLVCGGLLWFHKTLDFITDWVPCSHSTTGCQCKGANQRKNLTGSKDKWLKN